MQSMRLEELIDLYGDAILRLCLLYLGDRQLAEDAFQETFLKAWKKWDTFRGASSVKTWLAHIAVNTCRDTLRSGWFRTMRRSVPVEQLFDMATDEDMQGDFAVRDAVLHLPGKYREMVVLRYQQEMTMREIAEMLRISESAAGSRLRRARALLRKELEEGAGE